MSDIIQTERVILRNTCEYAYTCIHIPTINEKRSQKFQRKKGGYMGEWI